MAVRKCKIQCRSSWDLSVIKTTQKYILQKYLSQNPTVPFVLAQRSFETPSNLITRLYTSTFWNPSMT